MQILVNSSNNIVVNVGKIEKGFFQVDKSTELFEIENDDGKFYAITQGYEVYYVEEIANKVTFDGKWCYKEESGFFENPNWKPDEKSEIEMLKRKHQAISAKIDYLAMMTDINLPD